MGKDQRAGAWRDRADQRREQTVRRRRVALGIAAAVVAGGVAAVVLTRPDPPTELTDASKALAVDWPTMSVDDLCSTWFRGDMSADRKDKLVRIFTRRGWLEARPAIRYVLDEMRLDERKGRSEYEIEGFPEDRRLKVYWDRVGNRWRVTAPSIPILERK